jgi:hypothetical protein
MPPVLSAERFDVRHAVMFDLGPRPPVTIVPPADVCGTAGIRVAALGEKPTSWLLVRRDAFGELRGLEVEVVPAPGPARLAIRLLRSSGRSIAEGMARIVSEREIAFRVAVPGKARRGPRARARIVAGRLITGARWRVRTRA